ncbi:D-amino-acid dehydrogenase/Ca-activated chloride channel family protein [Kroppenstedtia sanguinis]|uniref:vWA domain-containing protein n=1 Tax=Kroppenstedtia sanguinis TaxID=1380684 RepID=UPI003D1D96E0
MKRFPAFITIVSSVALMVSGCSTGEKGANPEKPEKKEEKIPQAAHKPEEIMKQKPGRFSGDNYDAKKVEQALDQFPDDLSTEEAYNRLVYLLGENYRPKYEELMSLDPTIRVNEKTPDNQIDAPSVEEMNVEILLDASGSMAGRVDGGIKMDLAKQAIRAFASDVPEGAQVSLRVYGHKGSNQKKDKEVSCKSNELVYPLKAYESGRFEQSLDRFKPTGWTPLASAIQAAREDLKEWAGEKTRNIVYVVSDGVETCGGDPVKEAKKLGESGIEPMVKIIGFDVDDAGQQQLKKVAEAEGSYQTVTSGDDLKKYLEGEKERIKREWEDWSIYSQNKATEKWAEKVRKVRDLLFKKPDGNERGIAYIKVLEINHLDEAVEYLEKKGKLKDEEGLSDKIYWRDSNMTKFFDKLEVSMVNKLDEAEKKTKEDIKDQEEEMTKQ